MLADTKFPNANGWRDRHDNAILHPSNLVEAAFVNMIRGWQQYATQNESRFGGKIGADRILGPAWRQIGDSLCTLLDGDLGNRLDRGTLDEFIAETMKQNGIDTEE